MAVPCFAKMQPTSDGCGHRLSAAVQARTPLDWRTLTCACVHLRSFMSIPVLCLQARYHEHMETLRTRSCRMHPLPIYGQMPAARTRHSVGQNGESGTSVTEAGLFLSPLLSHCPCAPPLAAWAIVRLVERRVDKPRLAPSRFWFQRYMRSPGTGRSWCVSMGRALGKRVILARLLPAGSIPARSTSSIAG